MKQNLTMEKFKWVAICLSFITSTTLMGQVTVCLGDDAIVCQGQNVTINACPNTGGGGLFLNNPTSVSLTDDSWSGLIPIGFSFSFYGNVYTQCVIGSNGIVSFDASQANGYCAYALNGTPLPTTSMPSAMNAAMGCYQDINPSNANSGQIQYQTVGSAPNRKFVVLYNGITMFSCTSNCHYSAFIFSESSNEIEFHIGTKGFCGTWNGDLAIQGVQNSSGSAAVTTPGRNNTVWSAMQDGKKYTPVSPLATTNYTVSTIPYLNVVAPGGNLMWKSTLGQTFPYNNGQLIVNQVPPGTTGYFLVSTSCGVSVGSASDTTFLTRTTASVTASSTAALCGTNSGTLKATATNGTGPFTFSWPSLGQSGDSLSNIAPGNYAVVMTDANGCTATASTSIQNINPTLSADSTVVSCSGGSDGTATAYMTPTGNNTTYQWNDPSNQTTQTATGLSAGIYQCVITSDNGCTDSISVEVTELQSLQVSIKNQQDVTCYTKNDGIIEVSIVGGTQPYTLLWSGSSSSDSSVFDFYAGNQDLLVTDNNGCTSAINTFLDEPEPLQIDFISNDTMICSESSTTISVIGSGGSTAYTYNWYENNVYIASGSSIIVDPIDSGTVYVAEMTEACGSPNAYDTMTIIFPTPIVPLFTPNKPTGCAPDRFYFFNQSSNMVEIDSVYSQFSNGDQFATLATDTLSSYFVSPGTYDLYTTIISTYGCVYEGYFPAIVEALKRPEARFSTSANPITIFETYVQLNDNSVDAVAWQWSIPGANPSASTTQNLAVNFPSNEGKYPMQLKVTSSEGCSDSTTVIMVVESDLILYAPTAFTPDGDQHNQTWRIEASGLDLLEFELTIYDRWGNPIWYSKDAKANWDGTYKGKVAPEGSYSWVCKIQQKDKPNPQIIRGNVILIR